MPKKDIRKKKKEKETRAIIAAQDAEQKLLNSLGDVGRLARKLNSEHSFTLSNSTSGQ